MLQQVSKDKSANIEALSKRLTFWQEGKLEDILNEAYDIQRKLNRSKTKPSASSKKNQEKIRFITAVRNRDIRGAARSIDPDNFGLVDWNEDVKKSLRYKFPPAKSPDFCKFGFCHSLDIRNRPNSCSKNLDALIRKS